MLTIAMHGCSGHMGRVICDLAAADPSVRIGCGIDIHTPEPAPEFPVFSSLRECTADYDVVVDFSTASAVSALLSDCVRADKPLVLCTTGLSEAQKQEVLLTSKTIPVFYSANMSIGINLITALSRKAAKILAPAGFDIEISERHHNRKLDAPSGTALAIGEALIHELGNEYHMDMDRMERRAPRDPKSIGMSSVRGGTIVGEHTVLFAGHDELIEIHHTALSREVFASGAISAARFIVTRPAGLYDMTQMIEA